MILFFLPTYIMFWESAGNTHEGLSGRGNRPPQHGREDRAGYVYSAHSADSPVTAWILWVHRVRKQTGFCFRQGHKMDDIIFDEPRLELALSSSLCFDFILDLFKWTHCQLWTFPRWREMLHLFNNDSHSFLWTFEDKSELSINTHTRAHTHTLCYIFNDKGFQKWSFNIWQYLTEDWWRCFKI